MGKSYDSIPTSLQTWALEQKVFWVSTAPLGEDGLVNLSPKGVEGSFRIIDANRVWYEDLTGSGVSTIAHLRENGRITILFNAFEGPPNILRLYGKGTVYEFGTPEYEELLPPGKRQTGSRAVIMVDVFKVQTSCGFGVPFYTYRAPRHKLLKTASRFESGIPITSSSSSSSTTTTSPPSSTNAPEKPKLRTLKDYWASSNAVDIEGLPALTCAFESRTEFVRKQGMPKMEELPEDDERVGVWGQDEEVRLPKPVVTRTGSEKEGRGKEGKEVVEVEEGKKVGGVRQDDLKLVFAFFAGAVVTTSYLTYLRDFLTR